jgi:transposase-like protein
VRYEAEAHPREPSVLRAYHHVKPGIASPPLGGTSSDEAFWREFLRSLKRRGLSGVRLVISDQHAGLDAAIGRCFQGAGHQRCRVHFARNLMANIPKGHQEMVSVAFRTIFAQVSPEEISASGSTWPPCWPSASMSLAR